MFRMHFAGTIGTAIRRYYDQMNNMRKLFDSGRISLIGEGTK
jgi:hypothetical protein